MLELSLVPPFKMTEFAALKALVRGVFDGRLTAADCRLLVCVALIETLARTSLVCTSIPTVRKSLARFRRCAIAFGGEVPEHRVIWAIEASGRRRSSTCLTRALAAELLLPVDRRLTMVVGIATSQGSLSSHAWVERDGKVLVGGAESVQYLPLIAWNSGAR
jgi:hypothetical protein